MYGFRTLARSARWLRSRLTKHRGLILAYHRVHDTSWDPYSLSVSPAHYVEHLRILRRYANPISLQTLVDSIRSGNLAPRSVVVTLDDGYADNLHHAKPALGRFEIPATVFVASGYLGRKFWWDELASLCAPNRPVPQAICFNVNGRKFSWKSNGTHGGRTPVHVLFSLYRFFSLLTEPEKRDALEQLRRVLGSSTEEESDSRAMTRSELRELANGGLVEVGAHTVSHPFLAKLGEEAQRSEISESKESLEGLIGSRIESFCYPHGSLTNDTVATVRNAGFRCACASYTDVAICSNDPFRLPRFWIPNWNGPQFARWLHRWMDK